MTRRDVLRLGGIGLIGTSIFAGIGCAGADSILNPFVDAYTLSVRYAENTVGGLRIRTRTYAGGIPGPTIVTEPGHRLRVTIDNGLPPNPDAHEHPTNINNPHKFNTTNLHVHGLHVVPHLFQPVGTSNPDAEMIAVEPGTSYTYDFDLPEDHPTGLFWYHPHHHGSTALQVFNGMAGLIIVRGAIDRVPEIAAAREQIVAVQSLRLNPDKDDPTLYVMDPIPNKPPDQGGFQTNGFAKTMYTVNGEGVAWKGPEHNADNQQLAVNTISARPGEVIRFRMLNGTDEQFMPVQLDGHQLHVIGYDGIANPALRPTDVAELAPGNRCEFLVKCGDPGTYAFKQLPVNGQQFESSSGMTMLNLSVSGEPMPMQLPTSLPAGMQPLPGANAPGKSVMFNTVFPYPELLTGVGFQINNELYEEKRIDHTSRLDTVEEWEVMAHIDEGHPLHIHVNAFQVTQIGDEIVDPPVFKDTVWVPPGKTVKILVPYERFTGKSVYHCHILIHEDTGMMQNFIINR